MAYTDAFTDGDLTALETHSATWVNTDGGAGSMVIYQNQVAGYAGADVAAYYYNQTFASKHYSKLKWTGTYSPAAIGPAIRMAASANYYYCLIDNPGDEVFNGECINGSISDWDSGQTLPALNSVMELTVDATTETTIICKDDGATVATYTSKSALSGGKAGVCSWSIAEFGDDWEGGDISIPNVSLVPPNISRRMAHLFVR